ncbi:PREDICTED: WAP four-disulfide core domain protein 10A [Chrysochloris asiatica]|uniref:WAP four-disulfide core domain protein 10A n=1 Tax=Chrysochloris asiatica TaxID=185453 RepID=A0A9B0WHY9_CHRAS|nr:PREDICTED: WAP four-disulfide core domain protein 10A [Chrysochloris asiatica]
MTAAVRVMLPILLLCVLLLLQTQGGLHFRHGRILPKPQGFGEIKACERRPSKHLCKRHCEFHQQCQANNVCCSTFCGNVCMNLL